MRAAKTPAAAMRPAAAVICAPPALDEEVEEAPPAPPAPPLDEPPDPDPPLLEVDLADERVVLPTVDVKVEEPEVIVVTTAAVETAPETVEAPEPPEPPAPPAAAPKIVVAPRVEVMVVDPLVMAVTA